MLVQMQRNTQQRYNAYAAQPQQRRGTNGVRGLRDIVVLPPPTYIGYANSYATAAQYGDADNRRSWATFANTPITDYAKVGTLNVYKFGTSDWWFILSSSGALDNANATWVRYTGTATPTPPLGWMVGGSGTKTFSEFYSGSGGAAGGGNASTGGGYGGTVGGGTSTGGNTSTGGGTTTSGAPCDCPPNCREELQRETRFLNKTRASDSDIPVKVKVPRIVCPPKVTEYKTLCAEELAAIKRQYGLTGVSGVSGCSSCGTSSRFNGRM